MEIPNPDVSDCIDDGYNGFNRIYTVIDEVNILEYWFSDEIPITFQDVEVTFQVDMSMIMENSGEVKVRNINNDIALSNITFLNYQESRNSVSQSLFKAYNFDAITEDNNFLDKIYYYDMYSQEEHIDSDPVFIFS